MGIEVLRASEYLHNDKDVNIHVSIVEKEYATHTHEFIEMVFILSGEGIHIVNGEAHCIGAGELFLLNANIPHSFKADKDKAIIVYNCLFQPMSINLALDQNSSFVDVAYEYLFQSLREGEEPRRYIKITGVNTHEIKLMLDGICDEYTVRDKGYLQVIHSELTKLLIYIFRLYHNDQKQEHSHILFKRLVIQYTLEYMQKNYMETLTCGQLAERAYLSASYLSKIFHEETGYSLIQMLQCLRIEAAADLLKTTIFTVDVVAEKVGYSDLKHFYRIFKKITGYTPKEYRDNNQRHSVTS